MKLSIRVPLIAGMLFLLLTACTEHFVPDRQPLPAEQVSIRYTTWASKEADRTIIADFMKKYPNIKVVNEILDRSNYDVLMKTGILSGDPPDVFLLTGGQYGPYADQGWLMDVSGEPGTQSLRVSTLAALFARRSAETNRDSFYGSPVSGGALVVPIFYNKRVFERLGLSVPGTIEEWLAICERIKAAGLDPLVLGIKDRWPLEWLMESYSDSETLGTYPRLSNALYYGKALPSDVYRSSLTLMETLLNNKDIGRSSLTFSYDQSLQYFAEGKAAMLPMGTWAATEDWIRQADPAVFELGVFPFPYRPVQGVKHLGIDVQSVIAVSSNSKHPDEAKAFFNFFLEKRNLQKFLEARGESSLLEDVDAQVRHPDVLAGLLGDLSDRAHYRIHQSDDGDITLSPTFHDALLQSVFDIAGGSKLHDVLLGLDKALLQTKDDASGPGIAQNWGFNLDSRDGWTINGDMKAGVEGGRLNLQFDDANSNIESPDKLAIDAGRYTHIRLKLKAAGAGQIHIWFTTGSSFIWDQNKSASFNVAPDEEREYVLDMGGVPAWNGSIGQLRLTADKAIKKLSIDYVAVTSE